MAANDEVIKIVVVGDAGTGKTSLIQREEPKTAPPVLIFVEPVRGVAGYPPGEDCKAAHHYGTHRDQGHQEESLILYVNNHFSEKTKTTVGCDFSVKHLNVNGTEIRLQMWDIAGQERFGAHTSQVYFRGSLGALLVYDISEPSTFDTVEKWKREIDAMTSLPGDLGPIPVMLIGNKCDVESDDQVDRDHMDRFCQENGFLNWKDTSAYTGEGIEDAVRYLVERILTYEDVFRVKHDQEASFQPGDVGRQPTGNACC